MPSAGFLIFSGVMPLVKTYVLHARRHRLARHEYDHLQIHLDFSLSSSGMSWQGKASFRQRHPKGHPKSQ